LTANQWNSGDTKIFKNPDYARTGLNGFSGRTVMGRPGTTAVTLTLENTFGLPDGVTANVSFWYKALRPSNSAAAPFTIALLIDGVQVDSVNPVTTVGPPVWVLFSSSKASLTGKATMLSRRIAFQVTTTGQANTQIFAVDDFVVAPVSGPGGRPLCT
jgi:hypothetical protein